MAPVIDLRAVILLAGAMGALMAIVIAFCAAITRENIAGLGYWSAGPAVIFVSTLLFGARAIPARSDSRGDRQPAVDGRDLA